jgi:hypothetical protein
MCAAPHRHTKRPCQVVAADKEVSCEYVTQTVADSRKEAVLQLGTWKCVYEVITLNLSSHAMLKEGLRLEAVLQNVECDGRGFCTPRFFVRTPRGSSD